MSLLHPVKNIEHFGHLLGMRMMVLDMDGVLADFARGALNLHGLGVVPDGAVTQYGMHDLCGVEEGEFWKRITDAGPDFWAELPGYETTEALMRFAGIHRGGAMISSSCGKGGRYTKHAVVGKARWLWRHCDFALPLYTGRDKAVLAGQRTLLVDDLPANVEAFIAAGGSALLVDRPWNRDRTDLQRIHLESVFSETQN